MSGVTREHAIASCQTAFLKYRLLPFAVKHQSTGCYRGIHLCINVSFCLYFFSVLGAINVCQWSTVTQWMAAWLSLTLAWVSPDITLYGGLASKHKLTILEWSGFINVYSGWQICDPSEDHFSSSRTFCTPFHRFIPPPPSIPTPHRNVWVL